jgi:hypothetical protein
MTTWASGTDIRRLAIGHPREDKYEAIRELTEVAGRIVFRDGYNASINGSATGHGAELEIFMRQTTIYERC